MAGTFDDQIRAAMQGHSSRDDNAYQTARDMVARQANISAGRGNSTAYAPPVQQQVPVQGRAPQLPAQAPVPTPSPINAMIEQQLAENIPVPTARPNPNAMEMGDASVMEATNWQPPVQVAGQPMPPDQVPIDVVAPQAPPVPVADEGAGVAGPIIGLLAATGGVAGAAALYQAAKRGDPDALRTFAANGIDPEDFSMFDAPNSPEQSMDQRFGGAVAPAPKPAKQSRPPTKDSNAPKVKAVDQQEKAPAAKANEPKNTRMDEDALRAKTSRLRARNLPNSRPKIKPKVKVRAK